MNDQRFGSDFKTVLSSNILELATIYTSTHELSLKICLIFIKNNQDSKKLFEHIRF